MGLIRGQGQGTKIPNAACIGVGLGSHEGGRKKRKEKNNLQNRRKYFQIIYLIRRKYSEYIKDSYNSTNKKQNNQVNKWTKNLLSKVDIPNVNKHFKIA